MKLKKKTDKLTAYGQLTRILTLINILKNRKMTIEEIAERFDVNKRTAYRFIGVLEECEEFISLEQDFNRRWFITNQELPVIKFENIKHKWEYETNEIQQRSASE